MKHFQENGEVKSFTGNSDTNTVKKNALPAEVYTKAIRFFPKSYSGGIALRVELYGYPAGMLNVFTYTQWLIETRFVSNMPWNTKCVNSSYGEVKRFLSLRRSRTKPSLSAAFGARCMAAIFIEFTSHNVSRSSTLTVSRYIEQFCDVQNGPGNQRKT